MKILIVGSGLFGSICANELKKQGHEILVIDKRDHIGGNCYSERIDGIDIHKYGPHIFHTNDAKIWDWINNLVQINNFTLRPLANYKGDIYSLPFSMWTFSKLWGIVHPDEARSIITKQSEGITKPRNLEEQAIKLVGKDIYNILIREYTIKQWRKEPIELPASIIKRLPVRFTYDNNYFNDKYQGIPIDGYTAIFEKLLLNIEVRLNTDFFSFNSSCFDKIIYTGPIDRYYDYCFGRLEYKTTRFEHSRIETSNFQGTAMMNYTSLDVDYTRIIEHKYFSTDEKILNLGYSWITHEYPTEFMQNSEPMYPVNDEINQKIYSKYLEKANCEEKVFFGGRLAEYKYYDMHQVIARALKFAGQFNQ